MIENYTATSTAEFIEIVSSLTISEKLIHWYRGQSNSTWELKPTVWRDYTRLQERYMVNEFLFKAGTRMEQNIPSNDWASWISLMQHHGLPTRLLDWTKSPLISLYFAIGNFHRTLSDNPKDDACIWILSPGKLNLEFGFEDIIYPISYNKPKQMILPAFKENKENQKVLAVSAIESNLRMMVQQSAFTIHSLRTSLEKTENSYAYLKKITIPKDNIIDISVNLEILGLRPSNIYPDLDNLSMEIRRLHKDK